MKAVRKLSAVLIAALLVSVCCGLTAAANSAWFYAEGTNSAGIVVLEGECPLEVESEHLVFDIHDLPEVNMDITDREAYSASVTAEYVFYNPTDLSVSASLVFPFDAVPSYAVQAAPDSGYSDLDGCSILVDGAEAERSVRYTYFDPYVNDLDLQEHIRWMSDSIIKDDFFVPSTPVTIITYRIPGGASYADMSFSDPGSGCRVMSYTVPLGTAFEDGVCTLSFSSGEEASVCIFGDASAFDPDWEFVQSEDNAVNAARMSVTETSRQTYTFYDLAMSERPEDSAVPGHEWYNAVLMKLMEKTKRSPMDWCIDCDASLADAGLPWDIEDQLLRWYQYDLNVGPRQTVVNSVEAPLYPLISGGHQFLNSWSELPGYSYTYLLSPAQSWAGFGEIRIDVLTPYVINDFSIDGFEQTDEGYSAVLDGLPDGELTFYVIDPDYEDEVSGSDRGHCYIATCVYGDYDAPEVQALRRFRDDTLARTPAGRAFIKVYYAVSPELVERFGEDEWFRDLCRQPLDVLVYILSRV